MTARESGAVDWKWLGLSLLVSCVAAALITGILQAAMVIHDIPNPVLLRIDFSTVVILYIVITGVNRLAGDEVRQLIFEPGDR